MTFFLGTSGTEVSAEMFRSGPKRGLGFERRGHRFKPRLLELFFIRLKKKLFSFLFLVSYFDLQMQSNLWFWFGFIVVVDAAVVVVVVDNSGLDFGVNVSLFLLLIQRTNQQVAVNVFVSHACT